MALTDQEKKELKQDGLLLPKRVECFFMSYLETRNLKKWIR